MRFLKREFEKKSHTYIIFSDMNEFNEKFKVVFPEFQESFLLLQKNSKELVLIYSIDEMVDFKKIKEKLYSSLIDYFKENDDFSKKLHNYLKNQNDILFLRDFSLILYGIIEFLETNQLIKKIKFIFIMNMEGEVGCFQEFFSFIHGCMDFYQLKESITFFIISSKEMSRLVLMDRFPQLSDRFERSEH